jgi:DNA recombination protein RmuC
MEIILFILGGAIGAAVAWFWANGQTQLRISQAIAQEREAKNAAMIRLEESRKSLEEQKELLENAEAIFKTTFEALSGEALKSNNKAFLDLAAKSLDGVLKGAQGEIGEKTNEIKNVVAPLEETLKRYETQVRELEKSRAGAYGSLETQIQNLIQTNQILQRETGNLAAAFKNPNVRGQWGQFSLKRIVELSGMTEHCDFQEQVSVTDEDRRHQPDMIVRLPGGSQVVIDSKVVEYLVAGDDVARKAALIRHAQQIRKCMMDLSSKSYWSQFDKAPEFVVMFIPGEPFVSAACEQDPTLIEDGIENRVIIATPTTLIALLRSVAMGWRQEQVTKNTQEILNVAKELYERFQVFIENFTETGNCLEKAVKNFNKSVGSLDSRVFHSIRKLKEFGVSDEELKSIEPIEQTPRPIKSLDLFTTKN